MQESKFDLSKARYLEVIFPWEEEMCSYDPVDIEEEEEGVVPMVGNGYWHGVIDLKEHRLTDCPGWPYHLNAKVRDAGIYTLLNDEHHPICRYRGYVPALPFDESAWGDYIHLSVGPDKEILDWKGDFDFSAFEEYAHPLSQDEYEVLQEFYLKSIKIYPTKNETKMLEDAVRVMMTMHKGQTDKGGQPYFLHPMRVALNCETSLQKTVAFLHDVIEDTHLSSHDLKRHGFSAEVVEAVLSLTRKPQEDYEEFIGRCALNPTGCYVKIRDLEDNLNVTRLTELDYGATARINKYLKALRFLKSLS